MWQVGELNWNSSSSSDKPIVFFNFPCILVAFWIVEVSIAKYKLFICTYVDILKKHVFDQFILKNIIRKRTSEVSLYFFQTLHL